MRRDVTTRERNQAIHFNPRTHEGCDSKDLGEYKAILHFNPRTHEGCDHYDTIRII